jgi:hypothetical protein
MFSRSHLKNIASVIAELELRLYQQCYEVMGNQNELTWVIDK